VDEGNRFIKAGNDSKAKDCYRKALSKARKVHGETSGLSIYICLKIADACSGYGKYNIAAEYMDKILELHGELCYKLPPEGLLNIISNAFSIYALCLSNEKFNKCMSFADKYISSLTKKDKQKYLAKFYFKLASQLRYLDRENEAIKVLQNAITWTDKDNFESHCNLLVNKAFCYSALNEFEKAQTDLKEAFKYASKLPSMRKDRETAKLLSKQTLLYIKEAGYWRNKKKFMKAEISLNKARNILNTIRDNNFYKKNLATIYLAHGWICYDQGKNPEAIRFYKKAIDVYGVGFDSKYSRAADTYLHLAGAYQNDKLAEKYYQKALIVANKNQNDILLQATILYFWGIYYCNNKRYEQGIRNLQTAVDKLEKKPSKFSKKIEKIKAKINFYIKKLNPKS
jgi:tetratricopeptide (TPR) repeat protein